MDIKKVRQFVKILKDNGLQEIEVEDSDSRIRITNGGQPMQAVYHTPQIMEPPVETTAAGAGKKVSESKYHIIKSPMVGTFYRTPSPDSPPYVEEGQSINKGQALCIVEAMKLMNEIESDIKGKIVSILVENGQPVEYGEALFEIDPA